MEIQVDIFDKIPNTTSDLPKTFLSQKQLITSTSIL